MIPADEKEKEDGGWRPVGEGVTRLWNLGTNDIIFEHMNYYFDRESAYVITLIMLITIVLYFVTSSDSASFVVDMLAANGEPNPPITQKIFWAFTEGITAIVLLQSADEDNPQAALNTVKALPVILGLPYTFFLFWCCQSLVILCKEEMGLLDINRKNFKNSLVFNLQPMSFVAWVAPFLPLGQIAAKTWGGPMVLWMVAFGLEQLAVIVMCLMGAADMAWTHMAGAAYFCMMLTVAALRSSTRQKLGITGDLVSDACACCFWFPFAIGQMIGEDFTDLPKPKSVEPSTVGAAADVDTNI
jgi:hypothetical protein